MLVRIASAGMGWIVDSPWCNSQDSNAVDPSFKELQVT